ncbi:MAG: 23S rRNA (adenine(2503)-C(2))-methyltransferase RlmN [Candidatus Hinthialibacter antarcticus]|nr:23S rRNA (adenine(2503)-C(2))-methyltransferase RlmN [Candidatus Hinthialibacter antarcticus]
MNQIISQNKPNCPSVWDFTRRDLQEYLVAKGHKRFHADQIMRWLYERGAATFEDMTDLSKEMRVNLSRQLDMQTPRIVAQQNDSADETTKLLLEFPDGERVETVRMPRFAERAKTDETTGKVREQDKQKIEGYTACLSTQAGCQFACKFCASGQSGLKRNLTPGEIVSQVMGFVCEGYDVSRIVFMGSGEPLHNFDNLSKAIDILTCEQGLNLSPRRITVSTVGLVPEIYRMAQEEWKVKLAVSLHATRDADREQLIPLARSYSLSQLKDALVHYQRVQKRRLTFEYLMISGLNDAAADAVRLKGICEDLLSHVNLIPFNAVPRSPFKSSNAKTVENFRRQLRKSGIDATVRYSRGRNIDAACGQLRQRYEKTEN